VRSAAIALLRGMLAGMLFGLMMANHAAGSSPQDAMMAGMMADMTADCRPFYPHSSDDEPNLRALADIGASPRTPRRVNVVKRSSRGKLERLILRRSRPKRQHVDNGTAICAPADQIKTD